MDGLKTVYRLRPDVRHRLVGGEAVIVQQAEGQVLAVNELGASILAAIDGIRAVSGIVLELMDDYDVDQEQLERDVVAFVDELELAQVIERASDR